MRAFDWTGWRPGAPLHDLIQNWLCLSRVTVGWSSPDGIFVVIRLTKWLAVNNQVPQRGFKRFFDAASPEWQPGL
jgi:hypothetical protein